MDQNGNWRENSPGHNYYLSDGCWRTKRTRLILVPILILLLRVQMKPGDCTSFVIIRTLNVPSFDEAWAISYNAISPQITKSNQIKKTISRSIEAAQLQRETSGRAEFSQNFKQHLPTINFFHHRFPQKPIIHQLSVLRPKKLYSCRARAVENWKNFLHYRSGKRARAGNLSRRPAAKFLNEKKERSGAARARRFYISPARRIASPLYLSQKCCAPAGLYTYICTHTQTAFQDFARDS